MPWTETNPMNERVKFIAAFLEADETFVELCERFGISRKQGYKWRDRYESGGVEALKDRSRAPHHHPNAVSRATVELILAARKKHPRWGPKKLLVVLRRRHTTTQFPATSTVGLILGKHGLVGRPRRVRRNQKYVGPLRTYEKANAIWCADFKGHFPIDGERCSPLTISDGFSRYLLRCVALKSSTCAPVKRVFERAFREFGLPDNIRTDNGPPFSTLAAGGLSRLAVWWIRLGINPERILPGRPDQNGRHERMHRTLKAETARPPRSSFRSQQRAFDAFLHEYNNVRPHEALGQVTPASLYTPSLRPYPRTLLEPEYPDHFRVERAYPNGVISIGAVQFYLSQCLAGELVGLEQVNDEVWKVYFGPIALGVIDAHRAKRIRNGRSFALLIRADGETNSGRGRRRANPKILSPMSPV
jgi:transposase InsO family protein